MNPTQQTIIDELGLSTIDPARQADILNKMAEVVQYRVAARLPEVLTEHQRAELDQLSDENPDAMFKYLAKQVPGYQNIVREETQKLRNEMQQGAGEINEQVTQYINQKRGQ